LKVLVLKASGDLMANTPFECLLENAGLQIDVLDAREQRERFIGERRKAVLLV